MPTISRNFNLLRKLMGWGIYPWIAPRITWPLLRASLGGEVQTTASDYNSGRMKYYLQVVGLLLGGMCAVCPLWGQGEPAVSCRFLSDTLRIGEPCTLRVTFRVSPQTLVTLQDGLAEFQPFQVVEAYTPDPIRKDGQDWYIFEYVLRSFSLQKDQGLSLQYTLTTGALSQVRNVTCISPFMKSSLAGRDNPQYLRDTSLLPVSTPVNYYRFFGIGLMIAAGILGFWRILRPRFRNIQSRWAQTRSWNQLGDSMESPAKIAAGSGNIHHPVKWAMEGLFRP